MSYYNADPLPLGGTLFISSQTVHDDTPYGKHMSGTGCSAPYPTIPRKPALSYHETVRTLTADITEALVPYAHLHSGFIQQTIVNEQKGVVIFYIALGQLNGYYHNNATIRDRVIVEALREFNDTDATVHLSKTGDNEVKITIPYPLGHAKSLHLMSRRELLRFHGYELDRRLTKAREPLKTELANSQQKLQTVRDTVEDFLYGPASSVPEENAQAAIEAFKRIRDLLDLTTGDQAGQPAGQNQ